MRSLASSSVPYRSRSFPTGENPMPASICAKIVPDQVSRVPERSRALLPEFSINSFKINTVPYANSKTRESGGNRVKYRTATFNDFNDLGVGNGFRERAAKSLKNLRYRFPIYPLTGMGAYKAPSPRGEGRASEPRAAA